MTDSPSAIHSAVAPCLPGNTEPPNVYDDFATFAQMVESVAQAQEENHVEDQEHAPQQQVATLLNYIQEDILQANNQDKASFMIMLLQKTAHLSDVVTNKFIKLLNSILKLYDVGVGTDSVTFVSTHPNYLYVAFGEDVSKYPKKLEKVSSP